MVEKNNERIIASNNITTELLQTEEQILKTTIDPYKTRNNIEYDFNRNDINMDPKTLAYVKSAANPKARARYIDRYVDTNTYERNADGSVKTENGVRVRKKNSVGKYISDDSTYFCSGFTGAVANAIACAQGTSIYARSLGGTRNLHNVLDSRFFSKIDIQKLDITQLKSLADGSMFTVLKVGSDYSDYGTTHTMVKCGDGFLDLVGKKMRYITYNDFHKSAKSKNGADGLRHFYIGKTKYKIISGNKPAVSKIFQSKFKEVQTHPEYSGRDQYSIGSNAPMSAMEFASKVADVCMCTTEFAMTQIVAQNNIKHLGSTYAKLHINIIGYPGAIEKAINLGYNLNISYKIKGVEINHEDKTFTTSELASNGGKTKTKPSTGKSQVAPSMASQESKSTPSISPKRNTIPNKNIKPKSSYDAGVYI